MARGINPVCVVTNLMGEGVGMDGGRSSQMSVGSLEIKAGLESELTR